MRLPSGDQVGGAKSASIRISVTFGPFGCVTTTCARSPPSGSLAQASRDPSGDQAGENSGAGSFETLVIVAPSAETVKISAWLPSVTLVSGTSTVVASF